jgi:tripartite-type tricarboxylate transporter receptor subunit TctC
MNGPRSRFLRLAAGVSALFALVAAPLHAAWSQARTIRIIAPSAPAGVNDILSRLLGDELTRARGITTVVENRPGAGEVIGTESVARALADGNTVLFAANPFVINPSLRKVNYHPLTSFEPICLLVTAPTLIVVNSKSPYRTLGDYLDAARAKPGTITLGSIGPGSPFHLGFEQLKRATKVEMTFVPYPGNGPAVNALLGEHLTSMFGTYSNVAPHLKTGRLRALAAGTPTRIAQLPELPTVAESGFAGFEVAAWFGTFAPAKTPKDTVSELARWFSAAMQAPEVRAKLDAQGLYPAGTCGTDFAAYLRAQYEEYGRIIREANIQGQ